MAVLALVGLSPREGRAEWLAAAEPDPVVLRTTNVDGDSGTTLVAAAIGEEPETASGADAPALHEPGSTLTAGPAAVTEALWTCRADRAPSVRRVGPRQIRGPPGN